jgi:CO dehydrogenase/acetyl-CoA synthase beta subunit
MHFFGTPLLGMLSFRVELNLTILTPETKITQSSFQARSGSSEPREEEEEEEEEEAKGKSLLKQMNAKKRGIPNTRKPTVSGVQLLLRNPKLQSS